MNEYLWQEKRVALDSRRPDKVKKNGYVLTVGADKPCWSPILETFTDLHCLASNVRLVVPNSEGKQNFQDCLTQYLSEREKPVKPLPLSQHRRS